MHYLYIASFSGGGAGAGLYAYRWQPRLRRLALIGVENEAVENPLALATDHAQRYLFVSDCTADWQHGGRIASFSIDPPTGRLVHQASVASAGVIPVFLHVAPDDSNLLVANCGPFAPGAEGRTIAVFRIRSGGRIDEAKTCQQHSGSSVHPERQSSPHPHAVVLDPDARFAFAPDLGTDCIHTYAYDRKLGALLRVARVTRLPAGSGPRHMVFHPCGRFAYVNTELGNTVHAFRYTDGCLEPTHTCSTLPAADVEDGNGGDLKLHPNGRFLYATNRSQGSIASFRIDPDDGSLQPTGWHASGGEFPRGIAIDPTGHVLLAGNEHSGTVTAFRINQKDGRLKALGVLAELPGPACLSFATP
jgi:6-phosphogluconolactonase